MYIDFTSQPHTTPLHQYNAEKMEAPGYDNPDTSLGIINGMANGRGQPCTQQGMIVASVDFPRVEFEEREALLPTKAEVEDHRDKRSAKRKRDASAGGGSGGASGGAGGGSSEAEATWQQANLMQAPLGSAQCFQAMQGEVAFTGVDEFGVVERNLVSQDNSLSVTTTVNGWRTDRDAVFAGVVRYAPKLSVNDSKGTIAVCGTQTVVNTGPEPIHAGAHVYFSLTPTTSTNANGQLINRADVDEVGEPGAGAGDTHDGSDSTNPKFRPSLYQITDSTVHSFLRKGAFLVDDYFAKKERVQPPLEFNKRWLTECHEEAVAIYSAGQSEMPVFKYLKMCVAENASRYLLVIRTDYLSHNDKRTHMLEIEEFVNEYFTEGSKKRKKYLDSVGITEPSVSDFTPVATSSSSPGAEQKKAMNVLLCQISQAKTETICEQHNYLRRHLMGKAIRGNPPGSGIDIALGFAHS